MRRIFGKCLNVLIRIYNIPEKYREKKNIKEADKIVSGVSKWIGGEGIGTVQNIGVIENKTPTGIFDDIPELKEKIS